MARTWFVTGAGRGIGAEIVRAALAAGDNVAATTRDPRNIKRQFAVEATRLLALPLDVSNQGQVASAVEATVKQFGSVDVLVNNAGYGQLGVFEELSQEQVRAQFETNVFGLMEVTRAVLPRMRKQRHGRIFNISSVAGRKGVFGSSIYAASKFAVEGFSQGLADEAREFGVFVTAVAPGFFRTDFLDPSSVRYEGHQPIAEYAEGMKKFREFHDARNHTQLGDPAKLGALLVRLANLENPPAAIVAGSDAVEWALSVVKNEQAQLEAWRELSVSTDGDWTDARTDALPSVERRSLVSALQGTVALVTGASSGIGAATARKLASLGAKVALVARRRERLEDVARAIETAAGTAFTIEADVADRAQAADAVEQAVQRLGRLDILVNNAGVMFIGPVTGADIDEWTRMVEVNVLGQLHVAHAALPHLISAAEQGPRRVADLINIGSVGGRQPTPMNAVYGLTKAGIAAFTESLRQELTKRHVRVGLLEPGSVATELASHNRPEILENILGPYFREIETLTPDNIADAIAFMVTRPRRAAVFDLWFSPTEQV